MRHWRRYWSTLRHLRPVQIYGRVLFRLGRGRIEVRPAPPLRPAKRRRWIPVVSGDAKMTGPGRFQFLNESLDLRDHGWDDAAVGKLWRYNLHYFDDLNAIGSSQRTAWHADLIAAWMRENPPGAGTGWEPYPTSLRIVNWIKWSLAGHALSDAAMDSLAVQVRWLTSRLEYFILGNHLFANAKALIFAGLFFEGSEANAWLAKGMSILAAEVPEQILLDGGHFELSTMYHVIALEDVLDLFNLVDHFGDPLNAAQQTVAADLWRRIPTMRIWLSLMSHPDGDIGFFNDAALGIAASPTAIDSYARRLGFPKLAPPAEGISYMEASGYVRLQYGPIVALLDVAAVGPDYLPGHAHADTLSFELSAFGDRVVVNSGTSTYARGPERERQRGTSAHSTVCVNRADSSEVWAAFRVGRRARPFGLEISRATTATVRCSHDGYTHLPGRPVHTREWSLGSNFLNIQDTVLGTFEHAEARYYLHPAVTIEDLHVSENGRSSVLLRLQSGATVTVETDGGVIHPDRSVWHREFGIAVASHCLVVNFAGPKLRTRFSWSAPK